MSAFTDGRHRALTAPALLIVMMLGTGVGEAQTGRESIVNPGQSGPQGGGETGTSLNLGVGLAVWVCELRGQRSQ
jgi:hypothetical protein